MSIRVKVVRWTYLILLCIDKSIVIMIMNNMMGKKERRTKKRFALFFNGEGGI